MSKKFYIRRILEIFAQSIICSLPAYYAHVSGVGTESIAVGRMQMIFFFLFLAAVIYCQRGVYRFEKHWKHYIPISVVAYLPYTVLSICCYYALPQCFELIFLPLTFFKWFGMKISISVIIVNIFLYILIFVTPWAYKKLVQRNLGKKSF